MMKIRYAILLFFICSLGFSQEKRLSLDWESMLTDANAPLNSSSQLSQNENGSWQYMTQWEVNQPILETSIRLEDIVYESLPASQLSKLNKDILSSDVSYTIQTGKAREKYHALLNVTPFVVQNGQYKRIKSARVVYAFAKAYNSRSSIPITNSILASGDYYKFYVEETGVHQVTRNFLQSMGMSLDGIDPQTIKVYGLGGSPLPLRNSDNGDEVFDLREIPIQVVGGEDGSFTGNDHILFFGESARTFHEELNTNINPYSDRSYYYVTAGGNEGLRVQPMSQPPGIPTTTFTTFEDYQFHEEDLENIVLVGRRWFGEQFNIENEQTFDFNFPNIVSSQTANLKVRLAAASESQTSFEIAVNGSSVGTAILLPVNNISLATGRDFEVDIPISSPEVTITITYNNGGNPSSLGYLDFISLDVPRQLQGTGEQINFKKNEAATLSGLGEYVFTNASEYTQIWDVTDQTSITTTINEGGQGEISFKSPLGTLRHFVAVTPSDYFTPFRESNNTRVANQNLKGTIFQDDSGNFQDVDYIMITGDLLRPQAERLAAHNRTFRGLNVKVVTLNEIYEEFGSGSQDIGAIRNLVKYVYDNASSDANRLKYVCLFGDASVDYKDRLFGNNNIVPTFQTQQSFSLAQSIMSDDFFGFMDPNEGFVENSGGGNTNPSGANDRLDIAVGRILADTPSLATTLVDKIINYDSRESYGRWRNNLVMIADDADEPSTGHFGLQVNLDALSDEIENQRPSTNVIKIYSDAFQQQSSAGGDRYPQVNETISNALELGSLVVTYLGHGGEELLASEAIITQNEVDALANDERLPLLVTVTCEFTKFDNPLRPTGGEGFIWSADGGAVAMVATTREIFVSVGLEFNDEIAEEIFGFNDTELVSVAEHVRLAKNEVENSQRRVIFFLGDPAMRLAFPRPDVRLTAVNDIPVTQELPTLRALDRVKINGVVTSELGQVISNYTGTLAVTLYDKDVQRQTLGNDGTIVNGELGILDFKTLGAVLYRGQASVVNGQFEFEFIMPRDTAIPLGEGRLNFYSERLGVLEDQAGVNRDIIIGGLNEDAPPDNLGPRIRLFMNDESFVNGGITDDSPIILAKLEDENGINTAGGIGHDIIAIIDGDETNPLIMNDFYETEVDDFTRGTATRRLRDLEEGLHTLTFIAWDVYNNSSRAELQFVVVGDGELQLENVLNYPNPFVNYTEFWFNHNRPFEPLDVQVQIFTVSGKVVKTINQTVVNEGFLSRDIVWDGLDDFGQAIGKGVYVYKITVNSALTNKRVEKFEKLVIL
ncbi:type IX secretion system sortase PorU [uncultured Dokdonia sp.]|uniref:type IX secretion system sortase PorU n=1 Tax=uncultured Dokdonia sp. TaxID=575653 RepID=UPI002622231A|nr:type IX secretion system sortase PorU [uncultured Dokdonia sp.]